MVVALMFLTADTLWAGKLYLPNASFEAPVVEPVAPYAGTDIDYWQKTPQPFWYDPSTNGPWDQIAGEFYNVSYPGLYIDNADGIQAAFLFADPNAGFFQDYNSLSGTNLVPSHAFNSKFKPGRSYNLTVGVIGGGGNMLEGVPLQVSLYYRDGSNNRVTVVATNILNSTNTFATNTHFVDFQIQVPTVNSNDAWAGQNIGISFLSLADFGNSGGYWDIDNVRLVECIDIPNYSFESPVVEPVAPYASTDMDSWQKTAQPVWYVPGTNGLWDQLVGEFYNVPYPGLYIDNADGVQAAFLFALPGAGCFQDYNSVAGTNTVPTHAFNATFEAGKSYNLTAGLIGGGGNMQEGVSLQLALYYRDASSNMVTVAATNVVYTTNTFTTNTHFVDFQASLPIVNATDPWFGQNIGVALLSTDGFDNLGGYWDVDNVRLVETVANAFVNPVRTNGVFCVTLQSEPGLQFEIQASPIISGTNWTTIATVTNTTGVISFSDIATNLSQRFYRAHKL